MLTVACDKDEYKAAFDIKWGMTTIDSDLSEGRIASLCSTDCNKLLQESHSHTWHIEARARVRSMSANAVGELS